MTPASTRMRASGAGGFILIEILVALVVLGIMLGALADAAQSAISRAEVVRERVATASSAVAPEVGGAPWAWGPTVAQASWGPGPILEVAACGAGAGFVVGMWADGWLVGEWSSSGTDVVSVGRQTWVERAGAELVIRLRRADGVWGPPWRLVVPDASCRLDEETGRLRAVDDPIPIDPEVVAVHHPALCASVVQVAGSLPQDASPDGRPFLATVGQEGMCAVSLGDRQQVLTLERGRACDVFF